MAELRARARVEGRRMARVDFERKTSRSLIVANSNAIHFLRSKSLVPMSIEKFIVRFSAAEIETLG